jgi:hypothetical protein
MDTSGLTLAALFSAAAIAPAALIIREFVELLKAVFPALSARVSGAVQAFFASAVLYLIAYAAVGARTPEGGFQAFLAWLGVAVAAVGINAAVDHVAAVKAP